MQSDLKEFSDAAFEYCAQTMLEENRSMTPEAFRACLQAFDEGASATPEEALAKIGSMLDEGIRLGRPQ